MKYYTINEFISTYPKINRLIHNKDINYKDINHVYHNNQLKHDGSQYSLRYHSSKIINSPKYYHPLKKAKAIEMYDFYKLCFHLKSYLSSCMDLNPSNPYKNKDISGFFLSTDLGIMPDFDVIRFSNKNIININLKDKFKNVNTTVSTFKKQNHILQIIKDKIENERNTKVNIYDIVYIANENKFLLFNSNNDSYKEISISNVVKLMTASSSIEHNELFSLQPKDYVLSPNNNFNQYLKGEYWLTDTQQKYVEYILKHEGVYGVSGIAGSGKSLIAYDLIRKLQKDSNANILFIFCGNKEDIHKKLDNQFNNTKFISAEDLQKIDLNYYNYIFIDEAQNIYQSKLSTLLSFASNNYHGRRICFLYDPNQKLGVKDEGGLITSAIDPIQKDHKGKHFKLIKGIRSNKVITAFINAVMNIKHNNLPQINLDKLSKYVDIKYFKNAQLAKPYIISMESKGYHFLVPTGDSEHPYDASVSKFQDIVDEGYNSHHNIGCEYDKVITYIDNNLKYSKRGVLRKVDNEYYYLKNEVYINMSRAISKLSLLIIGNRNLYNEILNLIYKDRDFNHRMDRFYQSLNDNEKTKFIKFISAHTKFR